MFAMSWCSSEEVLLSDKNIERGIPAEELMDEANMLEQGFSLDIKHDFCTEQRNEWNCALNRKKTVLTFKAWSFKVWLYSVEL